MKIGDVQFSDEYDAPEAILISGSLARISGESLVQEVRRVRAGPDIFEINGYRYDETGAPAVGQDLAPLVQAVRVGGTWIKRQVR